MKQIWLVILPGLLILFVSACGNTGGQSQDLVGDEGTLTIQVENMVPPGAGGPCGPFVTNNETVKIFLPTGPQRGIGIPYNSKSAPYPLDLQTAPSLGIQVNFWYWTQHPNNPVGQGPPQNPDNSGANFLFKPGCTFTTKPPVYGDGKETYVIADVSSAMKDGICVVTIRPNKYTGCITPACCSPFDGAGKCQDSKPRTYECADPPR